MLKYVLICLLFVVPTKVIGGCDASQAHKALSMNLYHEARGETLEGILMVGSVTMNRVRSELFPDTVCGVVYQGRKNSQGMMVKHRCQFSWYCDGKSDVPNDDLKYAQMEKIASEILAGSYSDISDGATHYLNPTKVKKMPKWTQTYVFVGRVGGHNFYRAEGKL